MSVDHNKNIIEIHNLSFAYQDKLILENINLNIHQGDYLALIGSNGTGKTTLFKLILGLLQPLTGSIKFFGQDIKNFKNWEKIAYVPQKQQYFENNFPATANEVVAMGRYTKKGIFTKSSAEDKRAVTKAIEQVGMSKQQDELIGNLSGGQQQRIFIARALVNQPEVLFLDEPTTGIDYTSQNDLYQLLQELNKKLNITLVIISHDIERITQEVMHIACIDHTLTCHSSPEEYLAESNVTNISGQKFKSLIHHHN